MSDGTSPQIHRSTSPHPSAEALPDDRREEGGDRDVFEHPFASSHDELHHALHELSGTEDVASGSVAGAIDLRLPALKGTPAASDDLAGIVETTIDPAELALASFSIPVISLPAERALRMLLRAGAANGAAGSGAGPGLRWLSGVAELAADLLAEQRFLPTLYRLGGSRLEARWAPWLDDGETRRRIEHLLETMPPAARAAVDAARHAPWSILEEALLSITDATVRACLIEQSFDEAIAERDDERDLNVAWLRGLLGRSAALATNGAAAELFAAVREWMSALASPQHPRQYSLALRLEEPAVAESDAEARWLLSINLARQDGLVRAADLWRGETGAVGPDGRAEEIEEFILRETARAAALYEPLRDALHGSSLRTVGLSTDQAYSFLRDVAPIIEESGIRVIAPAWWGRPAGRLGLRLLLTPRDSAAGSASSASGAPAATESRLGLAALVGYQWQAAIGERALSLDEFKRLASRSAPLVHLGGQWIEVREEDLAAARDLLEREPAGDMTIIEAMQTAYGVRGPQLGLPVVGVESSGWLRELLEGGGRAGFSMVPQPGALHGELRPYQRTGLSWLAFLDRFGLGACLADDMGLGKTVQLIALLQHEREGTELPPPSEGGGRVVGALEQAQDATHPLAPSLEGRGSGRALRPTLIIAPMSVVSNWMREVQRFAPELRVHVHHGAERLAGEAFERAALEADVVITTYGLGNRDVDTLRRVHWRRVVLDEAQFVKNAPTKQAQAIRSLRADRRVALTGTPVENRLSELWSIMDFCNPGYLGAAAEFRREFAIPIERRRDHSRGEALRSLIRPFVLRRLKTDPDVVPDLPDLVESSEHAPLTDEQARMYREVVSDMLREVDAAEGIRRRGLVLAGIVRLKQICNHPASLGNENDLGDAGLPAPRSGGALSDGPAGSRASPIENGSPIPLAQRSGKVKVLLELLEEVLASGDRALIFTQYRRMGQLLARIIPHELHAPVLFLHGGSPRAKRQEMIDQFQSPSGRAPVFILSLRAGGVGLNLTAANHVFHFDRWWNPAVENQATDRAFRIGQTKTVQVHRIICTGTLEDRIDQMIEEKTELAETIVGAGDAWLTELSTTQLRDLLVLRESAMESEP